MMIKHNEALKLLERIKKMQNEIPKEFKSMPYSEYLKTLPENESNERREIDEKIYNYSKKFGFLRQAELALIYDISEKLAVEQCLTNPEFQKKDKLIQIELLFDKIEHELLSKPTDFISPQKISYFSDLIVPNPADKNSDLWNYIKSRIIKLITLMNLKSKENPRKVLSIKQYVTLCFELKLINKSESDRKEQAKQCINFVKEHHIFNKITIEINAKTEKTIYDNVRKYYSEFKYDVDFIMEIQKIIKDYELNSD